MASNVQVYGDPNAFWLHTTSQNSDTVYFKDNKTVNVEMQVIKDSTVLGFQRWYRWLMETQSGDKCNDIVYMMARLVRLNWPAWTTFQKYWNSKAKSLVSAVDINWGHLIKDQKIIMSSECKLSFPGTYT